MIGRKEEQRLLSTYTNREEAQFIVVYGRRRVGKTYLVRETFHDNFSFTYSGVANVNKQRQLQEFAKALRRYGKAVDRDFKDWFDAFDALRTLIESSSDSRRIIFIDEMPWMDNKRSDFVSALEHFWNGWASGQKHLTLIACGSAASWITKKIFRNRGGLYNRATLQIHLKPFTLAESKQLLDAEGVRMNLHDIIETYMIFGGIPYYLKMIDPKYGLPKNVDRLCFSENAPLRLEWDAIFQSLFQTPEKHVEVILAISKKQKGLTREEIVQKVHFPDGGNLTRILKELEESGFLRTYRPFGKAKRGMLYQLCDPFILFYLTWINKSSGISEEFWSGFTKTGAYNAWGGYAFEQLCLAHIPQIKRALGISGVLTHASAWRSDSKASAGAQIDLVIDREDNIIDLCEMKYASDEFTVDKNLDLTLRNRAGIFQRETRTRKAIHNVLVTTYGLTPGLYSSVFQAVITMETLVGE
jgi:AAA+ ATPase superfamily predicted ATPase